MQQADLIIKSQTIFNGDGSQPFAGGVAIKGDTIIAVGPDWVIDRYCGEGPEVRDYGDRLVMPGFNDSHAHFTYGAFLEDPDFYIGIWDTDSFEECMAKVKTFADSHPDNEWVFAPHVLQFKWAKPEMPTAAEIDAYISDRPVVLQQLDFHTLSANTMALEKAGITRDTPNPIDGVIYHDENGEPTGVFSNGATFLFTKDIYSPSKEVGKAVYARTVERFNSLGITALANLFPEGTGYDDPFEILDEMDAAGELNLRFNIVTGLEYTYDAESIAAEKAKHDDPARNVRWRGLKAIIDGVCSDHTAWMLEPYSNDPTTCGLPAMDPEVLRQRMLAACEAGYPVRIHAIGDRGIRFVLDVHEEAQQLYGKKGLRHVIEHDETVQPEDINRYAELGVLPAMQPMHMIFDLADKAKDDAVGDLRASYSWPMKTLLDAGAVVSLGTDFPIVGPEPLPGIYGAVTRQLADGTPEEGWYADERLTLAEALKCYTYNSAYTEYAEDEYGLLKAGMKADLIVLDRNLFAVEPHEYLEAEVILTLFGGKVVWEQ